jgi:pPIWI RE three-gene island domain Z
VRNRESWREPIVADLAEQWPADAGESSAGLLCDVELGLTVLNRVAADQPAISAWTLFGGYPYAAALGYAGDRESQRLLQVARYYLWPLRRRHTWALALERYLRLEDRLRAFMLTSPQDVAQPQSVTVASIRTTLYEQALAAPPAFATRARPVAGPGKHRFADRQQWASVTIPDNLVTAPTPVGHDLAPGERSEPVTVSWIELQSTAAFMDSELRAAGRESAWQRRLARIRLAVRRLNDGVFDPAAVLSIDGIMHMVGMVSAGKSTLRDVLAVWAAHKGKKVTLVVGDVAEVLSLVDLFTTLGLSAAQYSARRPEPGTSKGCTVAWGSAKRPNLLAHTDPGFDYLSSVCLIDGLRASEAAEPLAYGHAPCRSLRPVTPAQRVTLRSRNTSEDNAAEPPVRGRLHLCPLWSVCPRHHGARQLVTADIWVATPASLVHSGIPDHLNSEDVRYLEAAALRSDLIVVDEADRVQMQLDAMFSPSTTLAGTSPNSWLDEVAGHKVQELAREGRIQLSNHDVEAWTNAVNTVQVATDRLYGMLQQDDDIRQWAAVDYFSAWTLQEQLLNDWYPRKAGESNQPATDASDPTAGTAPRQQVRATLDAFLDDPFRDRSSDDPDAERLSILTLQLLYTDSATNVRAQLAAWVRALPDVAWDDDLAVRRSVRRLEFTVLLTALNTRLNLMTTIWPRVEAALNLDTTSNLLSRRPPADYNPIVTESPMGNVLGFQFHLDTQAPAARRTGELRFFRCAGVGRSLLLGLHQITSADHRRGPNVLLLSGTSWAGTSSRYHLQIPVTAVLEADHREVEAIRQSQFFIDPMVGPNGLPLRLSGASVPVRASSLEQMLGQLGRSALPGQPSPLQIEIDEIDGPDRQRILILVGSYDEAARAAQILDRMPEWQGRVCQLIADDANLDTAWQASTRTLRRGNVATFAETGAALLVAPLLAIERGHNILNEGGTAAIGSVYFLARPHPRPDDLTLAVQAINDWTIRQLADGSFQQFVRSAGSLDAAGAQFRLEARRQWRHFLNRRLSWSSLDSEEKISQTWDQLVVVWQVIGRLVRGGVPARVHFCDAAFAPKLAAFAGADTPDTSLLVSMRTVLERYFDHDSQTPDTDRTLVTMLYGPLYDALIRLA